MKKKKKHLRNSLVLSGSILLMSCITGNAIDKIIDLDDKTIMKSFSGSGEDSFYSVIKTFDEGVVAVGRSTSTDVGFTNIGNNDAVIIKYNSTGAQEWIKSISGSGNDVFLSVIETSDKGLLAVGYSQSSSVGFENKGGRDAIVVKYDSNGNQQWVKNYGGSGNEYFKSVTESQDGGYLVVGRSGSTNAQFTNRGADDAIVVKYDSNGNRQWVKNYGGSGNDEFHSIAITKDGGFVTVGASESNTADFYNEGNSDAMIIKYNSNGNQAWAKSFGNSYSDIFYSVIETSSGEIVAIGNSDSPNAGFVLNGGHDGVIVKYDSAGNQRLVKNFGGSGHEHFYSATKTLDDGILVSGRSRSKDFTFSNKGGFDGIIVKFNKNINQEWLKRFGGSGDDAFYSATENSDGDIIAVGESNSVDAGFEQKGVNDAIVIHKNESYNLIFDMIKDLELNNSEENFQKTKELVDNLPEGIFKEHFEELLDAMSMGSLDKKNVTANMDLYIKSENILMMSLDTNSITFEDFSGVEDMEKQNAVNISINSSLPYSLNAYLPAEIQNADKTNSMDKSILNIKENSEVDYQTFANTTDKIVLKDNNPAGNDLVHGVDLMLKGGIAHEKDVYKTTIKFEAEQK